MTGHREKWGVRTHPHVHCGGVNEMGRLRQAGSSADFHVRRRRGPWQVEVDGKQ